MLEPLDQFENDSRRNGLVKVSVLSFKSLWRVYFSSKVLITLYCVLRYTSCLPLRVE
jgi:hypothetical protein